MSELKKLLGKRIKEIRISKKMTQEKLSELTDIGTSSLSKIESGYFHPSDENLEKIANALDVEPYELYMFNHQQEPKILKNKLFNMLNNANDDKIKLIYKIVSCILN